MPLLSGIFKASLSFFVPGMQLSGKALACASLWVWSLASGLEGEASSLPRRLAFLG